MCWYTAVNFVGNLSTLSKVSKQTMTIMNTNAFTSEMLVQHEYFPAENHHQEKTLNALQLTIDYY